MKVCSVEGCNEKHCAKGLCHKHYDVERRKNKDKRKALTEMQKKYSKTEKGKATATKFSKSTKGQIKTRRNNNKRRARKKNASIIETFNNETIFSRDFYTCYICGLPIDKFLKHPDPLSPSLEHSIPLCKGGDHSLENCSSAHLICNLRKGDRLITGNFEGANI